MKKYLLILATLVAVFAVGHHLGASESPYPDWFANWFNDISVSGAAINKSNNITIEKLAHGTYNFSSDGGGTTGTAINLHAALPANSVVSQVYYFITTALTSAGPTNNMQLGCIQASGAGGATLKASNDTWLAATGFGAGIPTGTAATMVSSSTVCPLGLQVLSNANTAGKVDFYIRYSVSQ